MFAPVINILCFLCNGDSEDIEMAREMAMAREMEMIHSTNRQCTLQKKNKICAYLPRFAYS